MNNQYSKVQKSLCLPTLSWLVLLGALFFLILISGDNIFNKTNTLKMSLLTSAVTILFCYQLFVVSKLKYHNPKVLLLLFLPIMATFPGLISSEGQYSYALPYELVGQSLCILWAYLIYCRLVNFKDFDRFVWYLIPAIVFVCIVALLERAGLNPLIRFHINPFEAAWLNSPDIYLGVVERVKSTFGNINYFAGFLIQLIPLVVFLIIVVWKKNHEKEKLWLTKFIFLASVLVIMLLSLQFTGTRAAIAAFAVTITFFSVFYFTLIKRISFGYISIFLVLSIIVYSFSDPQLVSRFLNLFNYSAWQPRVLPWQAAWSSISEAPLLGYGIGSSYQLFFNFVDPDIRLWIGERSYNHVHFELLEVMQEGGILGILTYLSVWGFVFFCGWRLIREKTLPLDARILAIGLFCGLLAYHLHGLFSVAPRMIATRMVAYTLVAVLLVLAKQHLKLDLVFAQKCSRKNGSNILLACFLGAIWIWIIPYSSTQYSFSEALASHDSNTQVLKLASESSDIYVLDEAARAAVELRDGVSLQRTADKVSDIFPEYRKVAYYKAYAQYLSGNLTSSLKLALEAQDKDLYLPETNFLLTKLSFDLNDGVLFKKQLALAIKRLGCRTNVFECKRTRINILLGNMSAPIQFMKREDKLNVFVDRSLLTKLRDNIKKTKEENIYVPKEQAFKFVSMLGSSTFFEPKSLLQNEKITPEQLKDLTEYLQIKGNIRGLRPAFIKAYQSNLLITDSLWGQVHKFKKEEALFKQADESLNGQLHGVERRLAANIALTEFVRSREFLIGMSSWLAASLE